MFSPLVFCVFLFLMLILLIDAIEIIPNLRVRRILCRTHPLPHPLLQRKMRRTRKFGMISINPVNLIFSCAPYFMLIKCCIRMAVTQDWLISSS